MLFVQMLCFSKDELNQPRLFHEVPESEFNESLQLFKGVGIFGDRRIVEDVSLPCPIQLLEREEKYIILT